MSDENVFSVMKSGIILSMFNSGIFKQGRFKLKSGKSSPVYLDLRLLVSHPKLLRAVSAAMLKRAEGIKRDLLAPIPLAGLPIGTAMVVESDEPMIYPRPPKDHGTKQSIEGSYKEGDIALVVDDLITTGLSKINAIDSLVDARLVVNDVLVLIDREQGGKEDLGKHGINLHSVLTLREMLAELGFLRKITLDQHADILAELYG